MRRREVLLGGLALVAQPWALAAATPPLRIGYNAGGWPISRLSPSQQVEGLLFDALTRVMSQAGLEASHHAFPWARAQAMVERGELDALCTAPTPERMVYALFAPTPVLTLPYGVFHRHDDPRPARLRSVEQMRGLRQGSYLGNGYAKKYLEIERMKLESEKLSVLRLIALDRLDVFVEADVTVMLLRERPELQQRLRFTPLEFLPPVQYQFALRRGFANAEAVLERVERAIAHLRRGGVLDALVAEYRHKGVSGV